MHAMNDGALLDAWRAGDKRAGDALLSRHFQSLLRFFEHKAGADADELIQRTLLACAESYQRIRGEASFRTYLFTIARHELFRYFRQRNARRAHLDLSVTPVFDTSLSVTERMIRQEREAALERAVAQLPLDDQILLELFYGEDLDSYALAQVFEIEASSVRSRLRRARLSLERTLRESAHDPYDVGIC